MSDRASDSGERAHTAVINRSTPVTLGLFIAGIGAIVSGALVLVGAIWWAATLQTKLDTVIEEFHTTQKYAVTLEAKINDLEHRLTIVESARKP